MPNRFILTCLAICIILASGCAQNRLKPYLDSYSEYKKSAFVIDHGMHTAIVVEAKPMIEKLGLNDGFYGRFKYVEIGTGDAGYFQQEEIKFGTTLKALFLSTPAIVHMAGYNWSPAKRFPNSKTIEIKLSASSHEKLLSNIAASFRLTNGRAVELAVGRDEQSRFFESTDRYHMFYTCNNWTADMFQRADYPIQHRLAFFSDSVMRQIERVLTETGQECVIQTVENCSSYEKIDPASNRSR